MQPLRQKFGHFFALCGVFRFFRQVLKLLGVLPHVVQFLGPIGVPDIGEVFSPQGVPLFEQGKGCCFHGLLGVCQDCLLYTSDAADE